MPTITKDPGRGQPEQWGRRFPFAPNEILTSIPDTPQKRKDEYRWDDPQIYRSQTDHQVVLDSLWVLASSLKGMGGVPGVTDFLKAYVHGGTMLNDHNITRTAQEDIHTGSFLENNSSSHRSATLPRDYFVAMMTQVPWYHLPQATIKMSFGELYTDLYQQAARTGHAFTCRFTQSMLDPQATDIVTAWLPSIQQPSPSCLGDFLKLMGHRLEEASNGWARRVHLTTIVRVKEYCCAADTDSVIDVIQRSMMLFQRQWTTSHRGGELSKFGNFPSLDWVLRKDDALRSGWLSKDTEHGGRTLEDGDDDDTMSGPGLEFIEDDSSPGCYSLDEPGTQHESNDSDYVSLFEQSRKILDHMWCAVDPMTVNQAQTADWNFFKREMDTRWSDPLRRTMLLLAAMVNCRIPLSAAAWVNQRFVPVYCQFGELMVAPVLLAKHARQVVALRHQPYRMYSVGQHLADASGSTIGTPFGNDIFLVERSTKVPVGVLPDFLAKGRTSEEHVRLSSALYSGFCRVRTEVTVDIAARMLQVVGEVSPGRGESGGRSRHE